MYASLFPLCNSNLAVVPVCPPRGLLSIDLFLRFSLPVFRFPSQISATSYRSASNFRNLRSSSHCCSAFSLVFKNAAQPFDGFSFPTVSVLHSLTARVNTSPPAHKLLPGRKACSKLVRAIFFRSAYVNPYVCTARTYSFVKSILDTPSSSVERATGTPNCLYNGSGCSLPLTPRITSLLVRLISTITCFAAISLINWCGWSSYITSTP